MPFPNTKCKIQTNPQPKRTPIQPPHIPPPSHNPNPNITCHQPHQKQKIQNHPNKTTVTKRKNKLTVNKHNKTWEGERRKKSRTWAAAAAWAMIRETSQRWRAWSGEGGVGGLLKARVKGAFRSREKPPPPIGYGPAASYFLNNMNLMCLIYIFNI